MLSFTETGMPSSEDRGAPADRRWSLARAAARAPVSSSATKLLIVGSMRRTRSRHRSSSASALISVRRRAAAISVMLSIMLRSARRLA
jgi:hypothetical protein